MSLQTIIDEKEGLVSAAVIGALRSALNTHGHAVFLVPSFSQAYLAQKALSQESGLALGVTTTTPSAWVDERWEVWGDGRRIVSDVERRVLLRLALDGAPTSLATTPGVLASLARVARSAYAFIPAEGTEAWEDLTQGERDACKVLAGYRALLAERGIVERSEAMCTLARAIPSFSPVVVSGFVALPLALRTLLEAAAAQTDVTLFVPGAGSSAIDASQVKDLRLLEAAGPLAEWELVAREVADAAEAGASEVAIVVADVERAWRELSPKLFARGISSACSLRRRAASEGTIATFLAFAQSVAHLAELSEEWPTAVDGPEGPVPQLGDMSWWPPRELVDFLLSPAAQVDKQRAWALDAKWRGNRLLSPQKVLEQLQREGLTSRPVAKATASILKGRVGTAALQLARSLEEAGDAPGDVVSALALIQDVARTVGALGVSAQLRSGVRHQMRLGELVSLVSEVVTCGSVGSRVSLAVEGGSCKALICSRVEALSLAPDSVDVAICCSMISSEWPLSPVDDAAEALLEHLGADDVEPPLSAARRQLVSLIRASRGTVVLERVLHSADAKPTYPAVVLSEVLSYGGVDGEAPCVATREMGEADPASLLAVDGTDPSAVASLERMPAGVISASARDMVLVPREGEASLPGGIPSLSASQIESYLECPYKWFTLRRLGLEGCDADFSAMQMGSFAHRVLEVSRRRLMQHAAEEAGLVAPGELLDLEGGDITFVPGSGINEVNLPLARELVLLEFDYHLMHQRQRATTLATQALVPHTATEEYRLGLLRDDLVSAVEFELGKFRGFEPRYFELRFGGKGPRSHHVSYAGVDFVGSIDRVDVDAHGRAVVVDYKHKGAGSFASEYDVFSEESPSELAALNLPRRVQSLIYAQVIRRLFPDLKVVGAVYLSTQGGARHQHEIAGALDADAADQVMGQGLSDKRWQHMVAGGFGKISFEELLDETERLIAERISRLTEGHIEAEPVDEKACTWCPVTNCERRLG